jgi:hypothetical protein
MKKKSLATTRMHPWPLAIIGVFVVFISGAAAFITWAVGQNMDLVREDYYEHEILFQERIDAIQRTQPLRHQISVVYEPDPDKVRVKLPEAHAGLAGEIHVYRPSDARLDRRIKLRPDGRQEIDTSGWPGGLWKFQISWAANGEKFYCEQPLMIPGGP